MLDIFNSNAFSVVRLTQAINEITFVPGRVGELGLFGNESVDTISITIEKRGDILVLVPTSPRGAPGITLDKNKRDLRSLLIPHFEINDAIMAIEVQGIRQFGTTSSLETVANKVLMRLQTMVNSFAATEEYARMGAISGLVTYPAGSVDSNLNLFSEFGVSQLAEINFDLANATPASGALRKACAGVIRAMSDQLGGVPFSGIHAFCGDNFFDDLLANVEVRDTFKGWSEAQILREGYIGPSRSSYGIFEFGGIVWENYRGSVGATSFIDANKCRLFPMGVPALFKTVYGPADYIETVNTLGQRLYSKQYPMDNGKGHNLDCQMNALQYCSRPKVLIGGRRA